MVVCETYISSLFSVIYINLNITSPSRAESDATTTTDDARADVYGPTPTRGPDDYLRTVLVARGSDVDGSQPNAGCGYRTAGGGRRPGEPRPRLGTARGPLGHVLPRLRAPRRRGLHGRHRRVREALPDHPRIPRAPVDPGELHDHLRRTVESEGRQCQDSQRNSGTWAGRLRNIWGSWSSVSSPSLPASSVARCWRSWEAPGGSPHSAW